MMARGSGGTATSSVSASTSKQSERKTPVNNKKVPVADGKNTAVGKNAKQDKVSCKCYECEKSIEKHTHALLCEKCESKWRCTDCIGLSDSVYAELIENSTLHWFCPSCEEMIFQPDTNLGNEFSSKLDKLMEQMMKLDQKLESKADASTVASLEERLDGILDVTQQRVETKVDSIVMTLNQNANTVQECVEGALKLQLLEEKSEEAEKNKRKTSVIVHGVEESGAQDSDQRIKEDGDIMQEVLHQIKCDDVSVSQVIRLGKRPEGPDMKPRPIKMVLTSEESKEKVLRSAKNLRNRQEGGLNRVFIHQDLTPKERQARKLLVAELKDRIAKGEKNLTIVNGKIVMKKETRD